tara:strand:+ start:705 stop:995 length:291 start_codon:yes stop_codon:yes gene_type:complete
MQGMEKENSSFVSMLLCIVMVSFAVLMFYIPPVAGAVAYTVLAMMVYRVSHEGYSQVYPDATDFTVFVVAMLSAALWPLYFVFGACMFLGMVIRGE